VVTLQTNETGRQYRLPTSNDYQAVKNAIDQLAKINLQPLPNGMSRIPDESTPVGGGSGAGRAFSYHQYGMTQYKNVFAVRQNLSLAVLAQLISAREPLDHVLALALGKLVDLANAICRWEPVAECPRNVYAAGRVRPAWEFAEGVPISDSSGSFDVCLANLIDGIVSVGQLPRVGTTQIAAAQKSPLPDTVASVWFTDPPYYDAYPYADLSDVFFVWFKRALRSCDAIRDPFDFSNALTPKLSEAVQDESRISDGGPKDRAFFETTMGMSFAEGRRVIADNGIGCIVFAHKTTEGWEALLSGIISGKLTITASWPIATELAHRLRAKDSAALATSVHLVCRPRIGNEIGDWSDVFRALPGRVADWMERLQGHGGPGLCLHRPSPGNLQPLCPGARR